MNGRKVHIVGPCNTPFMYDPDLDNSDNVIVVLNNFDTYRYYESISLYSNITHMLSFYKCLPTNPSHDIITTLWETTNRTEQIYYRHIYGKGICKDNNITTALRLSSTYPSIKIYPKPLYLSLLDIGYKKEKLRPTAGITSLWYVLHQNPSEIHLHGLSYFTDSYDSTYVNDHLPANGTHRDYLEQNMFLYMYNNSTTPIYIHNDYLQRFVDLHTT